VLLTEHAQPAVVLRHTLGQPAQPATAQAEAPPAATTSAFAGGGVIAGAQPVVPSGTFESRWSAMR